MPRETTRTDREKDICILISVFFLFTARDYAWGQTSSFSLSENHRQGEPPVAAVVRASSSLTWPNGLTISQNHRQRKPPGVGQSVQSLGPLDQRNRRSPWTTANQREPPVAAVVRAGSGGTWPEGPALRGPSKSDLSISVFMSFFKTRTWPHLRTDHALEGAMALWLIYAFWYTK